MVTPYVPTVFSTPILNPAVGSVGPPSLPYLSLSQYRAAPTAMNTKVLEPGADAPTQAQVLADVIDRASSTANEMCFGADPSDSGAGLAASLSIESVTTRVKGGQLRLVCAYKPIRSVIGVDVGPNPSSLATIGEGFASAISFGVRTIYLPLYGVPVRQGDSGSPVTPWGWPATPWGSSGWSVYAVWSYVHGYAHTALAADVAKGATTCQVTATDGNGGVWGIIPGMTYLRVVDGDVTERVLVKAITPGTDTATLTVSAFANAHTLPDAPDFIPMTALTSGIEQALISITTALIKVRGVKSYVMASTPGSAPAKEVLAQAGATGDWATADRLLNPYKIRTKSKV